MQKDLQDYLRYYEFPANIRDKLKSTNVLERILREIIKGNKEDNKKSRIFSESEESGVIYIWLLKRSKVGILGRRQFTEKSDE